MREGCGERSTRAHFLSSEILKSSAGWREREPCCRRRSGSDQHRSRGLNLFAKLVNSFEHRGAQRRAGVM